jgi:response regulator RpfG family c-di-GMP phosphodiesterase
MSSIKNEELLKVEDNNRLKPQQQLQQQQRQHHHLMDVMMLDGVALVVCGHVKRYPIISLTHMAISRHIGAEILTGKVDVANFVKVTILMQNCSKIYNCGI